MIFIRRDFSTKNRVRASGNTSLIRYSQNIDSLTLYAGVHVKVFGYRRLLSKRFPFAVYYNIEENEEIAIVYRILDLRQNPKSIQEALI